MLGDLLRSRCGTILFLTAAMGLAASAPSRAQGTSCTTLPSQPCVPIFSDGGTFTLPQCPAQRVVQAGIMTECGSGAFCPGTAVTRDYMALFLENARHVFEPARLPAPTGMFSDVPVASSLACYIEQLYRDGVTAGCGTNPLSYCPSSPVTRAQMAVFILKAKWGSSWRPPACAGRFADVSCPNGFAVNWIEEFANECISAGCGGANFCPDQVTTREQMAVFLRKAFLVSNSCNPPACS